MGMLQEFKEFAMKGNLIDMAIGVVMGGAFGKVTASFIDGMVMPVVGMIQGKDFSNVYVGLNDATREASTAGLSLAKAKELGPVFAYGTFISEVITFLVVALVMFMVIKAMNKMKKAEAPAPPAGPSTTDALLMEIRDSLKK